MATKSTGSQLSISIELQGIIFHEGDIKSFQLINTINSVPRGEFIISDTTSQMLSERSGNFGGIMFSNVSDKLADKKSIIDFVVDAMIRISTTNTDSTYKILWHMATQSTLKKTTWAVKGTSIDAMIEAGKKFNFPVSEQLTDAKYDKPSDTMVWRYVSDDLWDSLDRTVQYSYLGNDYIYWAYDDVNNKIKVSSFNFEYAKHDDSIFMYSENAQNAIDNVKVVLDKPSITIWNYGASFRFNDLGNNREQLFPNIALSGSTNGEMQQAGCAGPCFDSVLQSTGDNSKETIRQETGYTDKEAVYGKLDIVRNYPNNTHKMYSLAQSMRDYYRSTHAKHVTLKLYNTMGPEIGSKTAVMYYTADSKVHGHIVDTVYSDTYVITEKTITYSILAPNNTGVMSTKNSSEITVTLKMVSRNMGNEGFDNVSKLANSLGQ